MRNLVLAGLAIAFAFGAAAAPPKKHTAKAAPKPAEVPLAPADDAQLSAAQRALLGHYACEFQQTVDIEKNPKQAGYVDLRFGKQLYTLKPVLSSTGALRLEDVKGQVLMIQIAFKSMLLDARAGRRLIDDCVHAQQALARQAAEHEPPQPGIGIDPAKAALAAETAAVAASAAASAAATAASAAALAAAASR